MQSSKTYKAINRMILPLGDGSILKGIEETKYDKVSPWTLHHMQLPIPVYTCATIRIGESMSSHLKTIRIL